MMDWKAACIIIKRICSTWIMMQMLITNAGSARIHLLSTQHHTVTKRDATHRHVPHGQERMPHKMALRIDVDAGKSMDLDLERNDHVHSMVPVVIGETNGKIKPWTSPNRQDFAVYTDIKNRAAMFVKSKENPDPLSEEYQYLGMFRMGEHDFTVEPPGFQSPRPQPVHSSDQGQGHHDGNDHGKGGHGKGGHSRGGRDRGGRDRRGHRRGHSRSKRATDDVTDNGDYVIQEVDRAEYNFTYDTAYTGRSCGRLHDSYTPQNHSLQGTLLPCSYRTLNRLELQEGYREEILQYSALTQDDKNVQYGVETLMAIDYSIYRNFYDRSSGETHTQRRDEAINDIRYYYTHIINGVDLRYMSIDEPDFGLYIRLSGFYIATTSESSLWTEGPMVREVDSTTGRVYTHAYKGLDEFEAWLKAYQQELPFFDQATLFVGNKLFGGYSSDGRRRNIAGLADISGVCTPLRAAICQENGQYASTQTAAHEMGHNLGGYHDGSQNSCRKEDQYIMVSTPTDLNDNNFYNPYKFSSCSIQEFREQIRVMNIRGVNCLLNEARHLNETEFDKHLHTPPGQMIPLDEQCVNLFGVNSHYCGGMINDERMCEELFCYDPFQQLCWRGHEQRAASGTTCGNKKWCEKGHCVYNDEAPEANDFCLTGDFVGTFIDGETCVDIGYNEQLLCYKDNYRDACCKTCAAIEDNTKPGCPYGDRYDWCADPSHQRSDNCYDDNFLNSCCGFCNEVFTGKQDCEYGDKASWCKTDVPDRVSLCYASEDRCCETCVLYSNGKPECEYGDHASWCSLYKSPGSEQPWRCYEYSIETQCCEYCDGVKEQYGFTGCTYGDRSEYCRSSDCSDSSNWYRCCYTCRYEAGYTERPQTTTTTSTTTTTTTPPPTTTTTLQHTTTSTAPTTTTTAHTGSEECVDSATWCDGLESHHCYTVSDICCQTCQQAYVSNPGCEYGDHFSWCIGSKDRCDEPSFSDCCVTCGVENPITTPTATVTTTTTTPSTTTKPTTTTTPTTTTDIPSGTSPTTTASTTTSDLPSSTPTTTTTESTSNADCVDAVSWCVNSDSYCYNPDDRESCCSTCARAATGIPGCEYGDHYQWCKDQDINCQSSYVKTGCCLTCKEGVSNTSTPDTTTTAATTTTTTVKHTPDKPDCAGDKWVDFCSKVKSNDCYLDSYIDHCCETCGTFHTGIQGCEYGDQWSWCINMNEIDCVRPDLITQCCYSCSKYIDLPASLKNTSTSGATSTVAMTTTVPWHVCSVDKASWCPTIFPSQCYGANRVCCDTCPQYFIGTGGCEYGNKVTWCVDVIREPSDCSRPDVLDNCCQSCDQYGFRQLEKHSEVNEGILVEVNSTKKELLRQQSQLLESVAKYTNIYCKKHIDKCCNQLGQVRPDSELSLLLPEDVFIASGYPKPNAANSVWNKILVRLDASNLGNICKRSPGNQGNGYSRVRRDVAAVYLNKTLLYSILEDNKYNIEMESGLTILQLIQPGTDIISDSWNITMILSICLSVTLTLLMVFVLVWIMKKKYSRVKQRRHVVPSSQICNNSLPIVFNTTSFSTNNHLDRRVYGIHEKHTNTDRPVTAKSLPSYGYAWPESPFHLDDRQAKSFQEADFLNNIDRVSDDFLKWNKNFGSLNNLIGSSDNLQGDDDIMEPDVNIDRVVRVYSGLEQNLFIPKNNCNRDSVNVNHIM